jgi:hypothetical protein
MILSTSIGQAKLAKSEKLDVFSIGVNLMPANTLGLFLQENKPLEIERAKQLFQKKGGNIETWQAREKSLLSISLCPNFSSCGARGGRNCLLGSGQNWMSQTSKVAKTMLYILHRDIFFEKISKEAKRHMKNRKEKTISGRFNLLSDIPSASMKFHNIMLGIAESEKKTYHAYEYTKLSYSIWQNKISEYNGKFRIVFSVNKGGGGEFSNNQARKDISTIAREATPFLANNQSIAIIVPDKQKEDCIKYAADLGFSAIDGDEHDIRTLDPERSIVFLSAKGMLRAEHKKENSFTDVFELSEVYDLLQEMK